MEVNTVKTMAFQGKGSYSQ